MIQIRPRSFRGKTVSLLGALVSGRALSFGDASDLGRRSD